MDDLHSHLTARQVETLAAMVDVIVPADEYPSGTEAGVLSYFGLHFCGDLADQLPHYRLGLDTVETEAHARYGRALNAMPAQQRQSLLQAIDSGEVQASWPVDPRLFFDAVVGHVMEGFYGDPGNGGNSDAVVGHVMEGFYGDPGNGGNSDAVSWRMIGFRVGD